MGGFSLRRTPAVLFDNGQVPLGAFNDPEDKTFSQGRPFSVRSLALESMFKNESKGAVQVCRSIYVGGKSEREREGIVWRFCRLVSLYEQVISVLQDSPIPILVQGWSMAESISGTENADYSIYVDINFADGNEIFQNVARKRYRESL